jgi:hypothetical protein
MVGEFSNSYMLSDAALERIAADLPGVRLTMTLRDPVERAYIGWAYEKRRRGWTPEQGDLWAGRPVARPAHAEV